MALFRREFGQALELARKAVPPDSKDYRDHIWLGRLQWAAGMPKEGEASLRRALVLADQVPETWVALVQHLARTKEKQQAEAVIHQAEQKLPKGTALLDLAQCYDMVGNAKRARELYEAAFAARPQDVDVLRGMVVLCLRSDRRDDAKAHLHTIIALKGSPPAAVSWANRVLALLTAARGGNQNTTAALALLGMTGDELPAITPTSANLDDLRAQAVILGNQRSARKRQQAISILEGMRRTQHITSDETFALAKLYDSVGDWRQTRGLMTDLLSAVAGKLHGAKTDAEKAIWQPRYTAYVAYYCGSLVRRDELREAQLWQAKLEELESGTRRTWDTKARLLAKNGKSAEAVEPLKALAAKHPDSLVSVARLLELIGQPRAAEEMFKQHATVAKEPQRLLVLALFFAPESRRGGAGRMRPGVAYLSARSRCQHQRGSALPREANRGPYATCGRSTPGRGGRPSNEGSVQE